MKPYFTRALLVLLAWSINTSAGWQDDKDPRLNDPVVTMAVVPTYPLTALHSHTSGKAVIEVKINSEDSVISAEKISGPALLVGGAKYTARRWKFAAATDGRSARVVRLSFVYHLVPRDTPIEELSAVFRPPYQVEITHVLADETPLP